MIFPSGHPSYKGNIKLGFNSSDEFEEFDTILAIGGLPRVSYMFSNPRMRIFNPKSKIIHIDNDPSEVATTEKTDVAIIMVEQNAKQALSISDRGYVLVTGENKFEGSGKELLNDPEVRRSFLGA